MDVPKSNCQLSTVNTGLVDSCLCLKKVYSDLTLILYSHVFS